jgi:hypothetical protein
MRSSCEEEVLRVMRVTIRDLMNSFRAIEQPFLKPEHQHQDPPSYPEKPPSHNHAISDDDSPSASHMHFTDRIGHEFRQCGFRERCMWAHRKADVQNLSSVLSRVETRRTAHEVAEVLGMGCDIGRDLGDVQYRIRAMEGRVGRVVGVRRVN